MTSGVGFEPTPPFGGVGWRMQLSTGFLAAQKENEGDKQLLDDVFRHIQSNQAM